MLRKLQFMKEIKLYEKTNFISQNNKEINQELISQMLKKSLNRPWNKFRNVDREIKINLNQQQVRY